MHALSDTRTHTHMHTRGWLPTPPALPRPHAHMHARARAHTHTYARTIAIDKEKAGKLAWEINQDDWANQAELTVEQLDWENDGDEVE